MNFLIDHGKTFYWGTSEWRVRSSCAHTIIRSPSHVHSRSYRPSSSGKPTKLLRG